MFHVTGNLRSPFAALAVLPVVLILGLLSDQPLQFVLASGAAYALAALGMDLMTGYGGLPNLGQGAFIGIGAYASSALMGQAELPFEAAFIGAILITAVVAAVIGFGAVRLAHAGLAVVTFSFAWVAYVLMNGTLLADFTGSANGLAVIPGSVFGASISTGDGLLVFSLGLLAIVILAIGVLLRSQWGHSLLAVKRSERLATSVGISAFRVKLLSFVIAAACAGAGGAIIAQASGFLSPEGFPLTLGIVIFSIAAVGGLGSICGAVIAAFAYVLISDFGAEYGSAGLWWPLLLLVTLMFAPAGFFGLLSAGSVRLRSTVDRLAADRSGRAPSAPQGGRARHAEPATSVVGEGTHPVPSSVGPRERPVAEDDILLDIRDVSLAYGGVSALSDVRIAVRRGSIHALVGPNGAGKTSMLDVLTGVAQPTAGEIRLGTQQLLQIPMRQRASAGYARSFQHPALVDDLTVLQNVQLGLRVTRDHHKIDKVAKRAASALALTAAGVPESLWSAYPADLSGGHQKLVDLARALVVQPDLLLLDEPTSGVTDDEAAVLAGAIVRAAEAGCTALLIDHNVAFVRTIADRVTVLDHGRVIADGPTAEILDRSDVVEAFVGVEAVDD